MTLNTKVTEKKDNVYSIGLEGSIDGETCEALEKTLEGLVNQNTKAVMLDMSGVHYISSAGIRVIITAKKNFEANNINFGMVNLQPQIKKIFDVMKILPLFDIFDDMPEADKYIDQVIRDEMAKGNE